MAESRELFLRHQLPEAAGERQALAALQFATDAADRLPPEVVARTGGVDGIARVLVAESARFYSSDLGGALLILSGERRSALGDFIEGQLSPQEVSGQSSRLLWSVSRADQDSSRFRARERLTSTGPQYLLAAALRGVDDAGIAGRSASDEQLLAVLVMHRGLNEDTARILIAARHDFAATQSAFDEWQTAVQAQNAEDAASAYAEEQRAATVEGVRRAMPFVVLGVVVLALLVTLVVQRRAASLAPDQRANRRAASASTAAVIVAGAIVAWISASDRDPIAALRQPVVLVIACALALVGLLSARSGSNPAVVAGVRGAVRTLPWMLAAAIIAAASMFLTETVGYASVLVVVVAAQAAMGVVLGEDIVAIARRHPASRGGGHAAWRHFLTVLAAVGAWASVNPLRLAPDHLALLMPAFAAVVAGGLASVVRGLVMAARKRNDTRRSPGTRPHEGGPMDRVGRTASRWSRGLVIGSVVVAAIAAVAGLWFHLSRTSSSAATASTVTGRAMAFPPARATATAVPAMPTSKDATPEAETPSDSVGSAGPSDGEIEPHFFAFGRVLGTYPQGTSSDGVGTQFDVQVQRPTSSDSSIWAGDAIQELPAAISPGCCREVLLIAGQRGCCRPGDDGFCQLGEYVLLDGFYDGNADEEFRGMRCLGDDYVEAVRIAQSMLPEWDGPARRPDDWEP